MLWELYPFARPLKTKGLHAPFCLRRHFDFKSLKPSLACKLFNFVISPIKTYNSEVWGTFPKSDFKSWDKSHLQFCKRNLKVHCKVSNMADWDIRDDWIRRSRLNPGLHTLPSHMTGLLATPAKARERTCPG